MRSLTLRYGMLCQEQSYLSNLIIGFTALILSFIISNYASEYASENALIPVADLILNYIELRDVSFIHVYAALTFWLTCALYILIYRPETLPFVTKTAALFILVRSGFICLTHIGAPVNNLTIPDNFSSFFIFDGDLFFSGHVGGPFLLMLLFWHNQSLRYFYLLSSIFFAYVVLAGHIHYSIDVFAAPFITYSIYQCSLFVFAKDYEYFKYGFNPVKQN